MHSGDLDTLNRKTHAGSRMGERSKSGSGVPWSTIVLVDGRPRFNRERRYSFQVRKVDMRWR